MTSDRRLLALKLALLFHDPPWKAWSVTARTPGLWRKLEDRLLGQGVGLEEYLDNAINCRRPRDLRPSDDGGRSGKVHEREGITLLAGVHRGLKEKGAEPGLLGVVEEALRFLYCGEDHDRVSWADALAASFDRIALNVYYKKTKSTGELRFINPFNPLEQRSLERGLDARVKEETILEFAAKLVEDLGEMGHLAPEVFLHVATVYLESLWFTHFPRTPPPADTRVPHHTVFDHNIASMAMANWVAQSKREPRGLMVTVDLAGVQAWISEARRLGDLWAASWLASALVWGIARPLLEKLGPDVLMLPSVRLNPFYHTWLYTRACGHPEGEDRGGVCGELKRLASTFHTSGEEITWPLAALMPNRLILILPTIEPGDCSAVTRVIRQAFRETWRSLMEDLHDSLHVLREAVDRVLSRGNGVDEEGKLRLFAELYNDRELITSLEPPFPLRVACVSIDEKLLSEYDSFLKAFKQELEKGESIQGYLRNLVSSRSSEGPPEVRRKLENALANLLSELQDGGRGKYTFLYPYLTYKVLQEKLGDYSLKLSKQAGPGYERYATRVWETYRRLTNKRSKPPLCSVCGTAYSLLSLDLEDRKGILGAIAGSRNNVSTRLARQLVQQGERLCPYCLVKRSLPLLLSDEKTSRRFTEALLGDRVSAMVRGKPIETGSVDFYVSRVYPFLDEVLEAAVELVRELSRGDEELLLAYDLVSRTLGTVFPRAHARVQELRERFLNKVSEATLRNLKESMKSEEPQDESVEAIFNNVFTLVLEAAVNPVLADEVADSIKANQGEFSEQVFQAVGRLVDMARRLFEERLREKKLGGATGTYYALVRADADDMGSGVLQGRLVMLPEKAKVLEEKPVRPALLYASVIVRAAGLKSRDEEDSVDLDEIVLLHGYLVERFHQAMRSGREGDEGEEETPPPATIATPSYHYTISRSLAATSALDYRAITGLGGMVIYSGGDDLLAILPPLDRRLTGGVGGEAGFTYPAIEAVIRTRRHFHGDGFADVGVASGEGGEEKGPVFTVPTLSSNGRSYSIVYARYKTPIWNAVWRSHCYLELKDHVIIQINKDKGARRYKKDILVIGSDRGDLSILPNRGRTLFNMVYGEPEKPASAAEALVKLLSRVHSPGRGPRFSLSLLYDLSNQLGVIEKLEEKGGLGARMIEYIARRNLENTRASKEEKEKLVKWLRELGRPMLAFRISAKKEHALEEAEECGDIEPIRRKTSLFTNLVRAARIVHTGVR